MCYTVDMNGIFRPFLFLIVFTVSVVSLAGQSLFSSMSYAFRGTILFFTGDNGLESDVMPILPSVGAAAILPILGPLAIEASLDFYGKEYDYSYVLNRAVPSLPDNRSSYVFGSVLGIDALGRFDLNRTMTLRAYGGLAMDIRICFVPYGLNADDTIDTKGSADGSKNISAVVQDIASYFWEEGRWFLPVAGAGFDYRLYPTVTLGFDARVWIPLYKLWTGEDLPPAEGWRFGVGFTVSIR
jgi:hypothetical protein